MAEVLANMEFEGITLVSFWVEIGHGFDERIKVLEVVFIFSWFKIII